jgi:hypothetical protein
MQTLAPIVVGLICQHQDARTLVTYSYSWVRALRRVTHVKSGMTDVLRGLLE